MMNHHEIDIGGKVRPVRMKMLAVKEFKRLTGLNLAGGKVLFTDFAENSTIEGKDGKEDKEFDPEQLTAFVYCVLINGCHPQKPDFTIDDVGDWINIYDKKLIPALFKLWVEEMTGRSTEDVFTELEKNIPAPASGANSVGTKSNEQPTVS